VESAGLSGVFAAAPTVDRAAIWIDTVNADRFPARCGHRPAGSGEIAGLQHHEGRVRRSFTPGASIAPDTVLLELSHPQLDRKP